MKKILSLIVLLTAMFSVHTLNAQDKVYRDKIYLNQGSVVVGAIIDYAPGDYVKIEIKSGKVLSFPDEFVKRIVMFQGSTVKTKTNVPLETKRIYNESEFAFLTGPFKLGVSFSHNVLYQQNLRFAYGLGLAVENYDMAPGRSIFPLYANAKVNLTHGTSAPYLGMKLGYGFAFESEEENITEADGGYMANPYFGYRLGSRGLILNLFMGLKIQKADYVITRSWETRREDILYRRIVFGSSITF